MTIALIADLHGNMTAVRALERDLGRRGVSAVWCLGDLVGKGPSSDLTFDWALANCSLILRGNWDEGIGRKLFPGDAFFYRQLGPQRMEKLLSFPLEHHLRLSGRDIRLFHGRPVMKELLSPHISPPEELEALFQDRFQVVGYADTHRQSLRVLSSGVLFNTGSVGNGLGRSVVQYAIMEGSPDEDGAPFDLRMVTLPYDIEAAVQEAERYPDLPNRDLFVRELRTGRYARSQQKDAEASFR